MTEEVKPVILQRRSHLLVYRPEAVDPKGWSELERRLSVFEKERSGATWVSYRAALRDMDPKKRRVLRLPGSVPSELLEAAFPTHAFSSTTVSWPSRKVAVRFREGEFPYKNEDQRRITEYLLTDDGFGTKLVVAGTSAGKSYASIRAWVQRGDVLLCSFAQFQHLSNFKAEILKFTDVQESEILVIDDGQDKVRRWLAKPDSEVSRIKVMMVLHRTIDASIKATIRGETEVSGSSVVADLALRLGVGTHISDEAHLELVSLVNFALLTNFDMTFYLTATAGRTEWSQERVLKNQLPFDRQLRIESASRLAVVQVAFDSRPTEKDITRSINQRGYFDLVRFFDYLARPEKYQAWEEMVTRFVQRCFDEGADSVGIVVAGRLEFLDMVVETMRRAFPERSVGNFSSRVKAGELREAEMHKDIVVTTEKSFGGSVNPVRMTHMIMTAPLASKVGVPQITGRLRGVDGAPCVLYDLYDAGFPKLADQRVDRRRVLKKIAISIDEETYSAQVQE